MKHTEGKLYSHGLVIDIDNGNKHDHLADMNPTSTVYTRVLEQQVANAERLVKCWNEHDALKAKADRCDGLVDMLQDIDAWFSFDPRPAKEQMKAMRKSIQELLAKK